MGPLDTWLWQTVLQYLGPDDLARVMLTSKSLSQTAKSPALWKSIVVRIMHGLDDLPAVGSDYYKIAAEIHRLRTKGPAADVISAALSATSTDNSQSVHETLVAKTVTFWSSCGDETDLEDDTVSYLLSGHISLLDRVNVCSLVSATCHRHTTTQLTFYQADYQNHCPLYPSKKVRISVGFPQGEAAFETLRQLGIGTPQAGKGMNGEWQGTEDGLLAMVDSAAWSYHSQEFDVAPTSECQTFKLDKLVPASLLKIELIGKTTVQAADDKYYVCLQTVQGLGFTLHPCSVSEELARVCVLSAVQYPAFTDYLAFLDELRPQEEKAAPAAGSSSESAKRQSAALALSQYSTVASYLKVNPPVRHEERGTDTEIELAIRTTFLLKDRLIKKYGPDLKLHTGSGYTKEEHAADMQDLQECHTITMSLLAKEFSGVPNQ